MVIELPIPESLETVLRAEYGESLERRVFEDLVVAWFGTGIISSGKVAELLGLSWVEGQAFLKNRGIPDSTTVEEVFAEAESLRRSRESQGR